MILMSCISNTRDSNACETCSIDSYTTYLRTESGDIYKIFPIGFDPFVGSPVKWGYTATMVKDSTCVPKKFKIVNGIIVFNANTTVSWIIK